MAPLYLLFVTPWAQQSRPNPFSPCSSIISPGIADVFRNTWKATKIRLWAKENKNQARQGEPSLISWVLVGPMYSFPLHTVWHSLTQRCGHCSFCLVPSSSLPVGQSPVPAPPWALLWVLDIPSSTALRRFLRGLNDRVSPENTLTLLWLRAP